MFLEFCSNLGGLDFLNTSISPSFSLVEVPQEPVTVDTYFSIIEGPSLETFSFLDSLNSAKPIRLSPTISVIYFDSEIYFFKGIELEKSSKPCF